jgi:hypothetical protein
LPLLSGTFGEPDNRMGMALYILLYTGSIYASSISEYFKNKNNAPHIASDDGIVFHKND